MKKTGTKEWAVTNVNIQLGCENGCRYCYARDNAVVFRKWCTAEQWLDPVTVISRVSKSYLKRGGVVMYPSTHDITPRNLSDSICVLRKLLKAGNKVLLVSKPRLDCISTICDELLEYRKRLMFRFTIGSSDDYVLHFWEPNAPAFCERKLCLMYAWSRKFHTSVSCEPFLDCEVDKIAALFEVLEPYVTDSFWIGKLRHFTKRVVLEGATPDDIERLVEPLRAAQSDEFVLGLCQRMNREPRILWKDSIREVMMAQGELFGVVVRPANQNGRDLLMRDCGCDIPDMLEDLPRNLSIERPPGKPGEKPLNHLTAWGTPKEEMPEQEPKDHFAHEGEGVPE